MEESFRLSTIVSKMLSPEHMQNLDILKVEIAQSLDPNLETNHLSCPMTDQDC